MFFAGLGVLAIGSQAMVAYTNRIGTAKSGHWWFFAGLASFLTAFVIWRLAWTGGELCVPRGFQGHAVWHVLSAVTVFSVYKYSARRAAWSSRFPPCCGFSSASGLAEDWPSAQASGNAGCGRRGDSDPRRGHHPRRPRSDLRRDRAGVQRLQVPGHEHHRAGARRHLVDVNTTAGLLVWIPAAYFGAPVPDAGRQLAPVGQLRLRQESQGRRVRCDHDWHGRRRGLVVARGDPHLAGPDLRINVHGQRTSWRSCST